MKYALGLFLVVSFLQLSGQTTDGETKLRLQPADTSRGWTPGGMFGLGFTQSSLTNWAAGGQNSIAINGLTSLFARYRKEKYSWENTFDAGYGILRQGKNASFTKTDDKVDFMSKFGLAASSKWNYAILLNCKTQLTPGFHLPDDSVRISEFLSPAYVLGAIGMDFKPNPHFDFFIAPATTKITIVGNQDLANAGAFGVDSATYDTAGNIIAGGKNARTEFGGYLRIFFSKNNFTREILKNVTLTTKLDLFVNYLENTKHVDVNWEALIAWKVNKYISMTLTTHLIYDHDINIGKDTNDDNVPDEFGPRIQFKEIFGAGLLYKF